MATEQFRDVAAVEVDRHGYLATGNMLIDGRVRMFIDTLVEEQFRREVDSWAAVNTGRLRTRLAIRFEVARELETLCTALGAWAFVEGREIFPDDESRFGAR